MLTSYQKKKKKPGIDNAKSKLKKLGTNLRESTTSKEKEKIFGGTYWELMEEQSRRGKPTTRPKRLSFILWISLV